jgi:APA family basic amino acid/polyamine antiporter
VISAIALMASLPWTTWVRLIVWFVLGLIVYFGYSVRRSKLANPPAKPVVQTQSK